jgi:hypothetical protein
MFEIKETDKYFTYNIPIKKNFLGGRKRKVISTIHCISLPLHPLFHPPT